MPGVPLMLDLLLLIVILSAVVYRLARFAILDTMIDGTRAQVFGRLAMREHFFWHKLLELLGCPWCLTGWVAIGTCLGWRWFVGDFAAPVFVWLAVWTGSLLFWRILDYEDDQ